jgi:uncharacterized flavoprotein (TIGR03862 family)
MIVMHRVAIIGAGPSALMGAQVLAEKGHHVAIYDRMPSPSRKFLIAGRGGLNLTHSEPLEDFLKRYGNAATWLAPAIRAFTPNDLRDWCEALGEPTFVGSSGRVFPRSMKAVSLLRAWLRHLEALGVSYHPRHEWLGWKDNMLQFRTQTGEQSVKADATLLALGGASWPRLGSDGSWVEILRAGGIEVSPLQPANCGFLVAWSDYLRERFAGHPLKPLAITHAGITHRGEAMITARGIEGGAVYALSGAIRNAIAREGFTRITLDLRPTMPLEALRTKLAERGNKSLSSFLRSANFSPLAIALLHETTLNAGGIDDLAARLKAVPLTLTGTTGFARAISTAGGITRDALDDHYMLRGKAGVFVAGEMLNWEAPTGGYLLQACFSTAVAAAQGIMHYLDQKRPND